MLPGSPPTLLRALRRALPAVLVLAVAARAAFALGAAIETPRVRDGALWCELRLSDLFDARVRESLSRGMPATIELHAELWRRRSGWFDRLESGFDASVRVRHEVWNETWRVERAGAAPLVLGSLDSVEVVLSRPIVLPVARAARLSGGAGYYVVVTATLRPLSVEDVEEIEGWLSGEVVDKRRAGFGVITGLPRAVFDTVRNFAGFGDQRARAVSPDFVPRPLDAAR